MLHQDNSSAKQRVNSVAVHNRSEVYSCQQCKCSAPVKWSREENVQSAGSKDGTDIETLSSQKQADAGKQNNHKHNEAAKQNHKINEQLWRNVPPMDVLLLKD